ncbi:unnamed protein product, partial [marine sediment metagenome]
MSRMLLPLALVLASSPALAAEPKAQPSDAARAVAALEARLAELLEQGTGLEHREAYEALLASATTAAEKHAADPAIARAFLVIARCCEALGKHPEKEVAFERYIETLLRRSRDEAVKALRQEVESLVARRELYVAIKTLQMMHARFPDGPEAAYALYRLGTCHLWMDQFEEAIAAFNEVLRRWPKDEVAPQARLRLARCHLLQ